jgi:hypothetical protein
MAHPYLLVDRFEDVTPPENVRLNKKCDRKITLYGYLRGCNMKRGTKVSICSFYGQWNLILSSVELDFELLCYFFVLWSANKQIIVFLFQKSVLA